MPAAEYSAPPLAVSNTIAILRRALGPAKLIVLTTENVAVYPVKAVPVPDATTGKGAFNYFVPILSLSLDDIDWVGDNLE